MSETYAEQHQNGVSIERLQELCDYKDAEIGDLQNRLQEAEEKIENRQYIIEQMELGWTLPSTGDEDILNLPVPRLEVRWHQYYKNQEEGDWSSYRVVYQLVYKHLLDNIVSIPFGVTDIRGYGNPADDPPWTRRKELDGICELPFRDGAHMVHDAAHFRLPLYAVTPDGETFRLDVDCDRQHRHRSLGLKHRRSLDVTGALVEGQ